MTWSLEDYCSKQVGIDLEKDDESLSLSTKQFLERLALPSIHPFCNDHNNNQNGNNENGSMITFPAQGVPPMGRLEHRFEDETWIEMLTTMWYMVAPPLLAMAELWLRLFAGLLGPLGVLYFIWKEWQNMIKSTSSSTTTKTTTTTKSATTSTTRMTCLICIVTVASNLVLMTDTLYVLENGPYYGAILFATSIVLSLRQCMQYEMTKTSIAITLLLILASHLIYNSDNNNNTTSSITFGDPIDEVRTIPEGLYHNPSNDYIQSIVDHWPKEHRTYNRQTGKTVWMPTGDSRTGLPFLLNFLPDPDKKRVFVRTDDDEYVSLDIAFPSKDIGGHNFSKPIYFILHGLNGGSNEEYIRDITYRCLEEGSTVIVMVARGLMDLPIRGWSNFHGARTSDAHAAATAIRKALGPNQIMVGIGYSMGAIILNNYVASYGPNVAFDGAMTLSGGLDMRYQEHFYRAQRLWQPMLTETIRNDFMLGKWGERYKQKLTHEQFVRALRASHVTEIDEWAVAPFNGFDNLNHYYVEMSAMGDIPHRPSDDLMDVFFVDHNDDNNNNTDSTETTITKNDDENNYNYKITTVSIPLCVVHALDDPLVSWRTVAQNEGLMHPNNLVQTGFGNVMILLTKAGGHVGWPIGMIPNIEKWKWMSNVAMSFVKSIDIAATGGAAAGGAQRNQQTNHS